MNSKQAAMIPCRHEFRGRKFVNLGIKMSCPLAILSIALLPAFVNGAEVKTSTAIANFGDLIQEVVAEGKKGVFEGITRFPEISKQTPIRARWAPERATLDAHRRWFRVVLDISTATARPTHVELCVEEIDKEASIARIHYLLLDLDGILKQCGVSLSSLDEKGKAKSGPSLAPFKYLDIKAPETRSRLKRELDFWQKGIGRKPPAPPAEEEIPR